MTLGHDHLCAAAILSALCLVAVTASSGHNDSCLRELDDFGQQHAGDLIGPDGKWLTQKLRNVRRLCQNGDGVRALQLLDKTSDDLRFKRADPVRR